MSGGFPRLPNPFGQGNRTHARVRVGEEFGSFRVEQLLSRDHTSNERVLVSCMHCQTERRAYVFNLRKEPRCPCKPKEWRARGGPVRVHETTLPVEARGHAGAGADALAPASVASNGSVAASVPVRTVSVVAPDESDGRESDVAGERCPVCHRGHGYREDDDESGATVRTWLCPQVTSEETVRLPDGSHVRKPRGAPRT